jgi:hypothetical protein
MLSTSRLGVVLHEYSAGTPRDAGPLKVLGH